MDIEKILLTRVAVKSQYLFVVGANPFSANQNVKYGGVYWIMVMAHTNTHTDNWSNSSLHIALSFNIFCAHVREYPKLLENIWVTFAGVVFRD